MFSRAIGAAVTITAAGITLVGCGASPQRSAADRAAANPAGAPMAPPSTQSPGNTVKSAGSAAPKTAGKPGDTPPSQQVKAAARSSVKLREFRTAGNKGYFYTASATEAAGASARYKFTPVSHNLGYLSAKPFKGSVTLYRLRFKPFSSYLVTLSSAERDKLANSGQFVYEGVLGYASKSKTGKTLLWRVADNNRWRVVRHDEVASLVAQGWHSDGPLGYAWKTA
jgi:hypothetical protein